ncbi:MAG: [protein-PII] uridylyltransferase [Pirellulales bacterium]|nr:[protein-PII] uridylyltransferase [Pirellulales bacterium]
MAMRPIVIRCRERLSQGREKARRQHDSGSPGMQVSTRLADLYDDVVLDIWNEATREHVTDQRLSNMSLVAHGGFGRRDLAPFSDADLMLLSTRSSESLAQKIAGDLTRDLVDAGIQTGFSIRSPEEACNLSWGDPVIFSSLTESRLLAGSLQLYSKFFNGLRQGAMRRRKRLIRDIVAARREERQKWGETNYLLRPNVKRSRGALRDIQLIRWIGFARYGETDLERLVKLGALPEEDYRKLRHSYGFMLRLRNELHFLEQKSQDTLDRSTQMDIAERWGYQGSEGMLPVEQFMQDYFDNTRNVRYAAAFFADDSRSRPLVSRIIERVLSRNIAEHIRMGPTHIWVPEAELDRFSSNLADVLRLMSLANQHRRRISHRTWQAIRIAMQERKPTPPDQESIEAFLSLLSRPGRLASLLRRLHELRVIEQLIPEFKRTRGLLQFNAYHKYTVDAHSIRAVEAATDLHNDTTGMGRRYRRLDDKGLLHLALLIHDIGKGYEEDHCIVGARIAKSVAQRLKLEPAAAETLEWLVLKHLAVNVVAFRHNLSDPEIVLSFAAEVGSIRRLEMLVVHTVCDLAAVGPGVATDWKMNLIEDLYKRTRRYFDSGNLPGSPDDPEIEATREKIRQHLVQQSAPESCHQLLESFPLSVLSRAEPEELAGQICHVSEKLAAGAATICTCSFDPRWKAMRYTIVHREHQRSIGTFARSTGALSTQGLVILRAQIETIGDGLAWDVFWVTDPESPEEPPAGRTDQICKRVCELLDTPAEPLPPHRRTWATQNNREPDSVNVLPKKVVFDNETVDRYTIVSFFAYDEVGLLYRIASALAEQRVVLHFAKIDTHLDQIADVFYVSEQDGSRLEDQDRQRQVRQALLAVVG